MNSRQLGVRSTATGSPGNGSQTPLPLNSPGTPPSTPTHMQTAGAALLGWWRATTLDALLVGIMWFAGLYFIHVPWAPLWALVGAVCQFVPGIGTALSVCGPLIAAFFASVDTGLDKVWWTLGLYAAIAILDGLLIQPLLLKRQTLVPWWAAMLGPIVGGILLPPWGALLAPPLLAVIFALRKRAER